MTERFFDHVFFDLGDTLIFFDGQLAEVTREASCSLARCLQKLGYPIEENTFVREFGERLRLYYREREADFIEDTTEYVLHSLLRGYGYRQIDPRHLRQALNEMYAVTENHWYAEQDAVPTLARLQNEGYHITLISNAADAQDVHRLVDKAGLRPYLELVLISAEVGIRKPHPRIFELALLYWRASPQRVVMVGDTLGADILGALNAGISSIWITRRASTPENNEQRSVIFPDATVKTLSEIPPLLRNWNHRT
ncbi:MAG: HAD family hydrolase [Anaerolineae bacterium]|nr:HAD family hydrolase [Anaerolineae bacterium]